MPKSPLGRHLRVFAALLSVTCGALAAADPLVTTAEGQLHGRRVGALNVPATAQSFEKNVRTRYGADADRFLALYPHGDDAAALDAANALARDNYMAALLYWSRAHTARNDSPVYAYLFAHASPVAVPPGWGAFHTAEVPYVFGILDRSRRPYTDADEAVSRQVQGYWLSFIRTGNPSREGLAPWPAS